MLYIHIYMYISIFIMLYNVIYVYIMLIFSLGYIWYIHDVWIPKDWLLLVDGQAT